MSRLPGWPLMLREELAAAYVGLEPGAFGRAVRRGALPGPRRLDGRPLWARPELEDWILGAAPAAGDGADALLAAIDGMRG
ncbi:MAG: hypothetical protein JSR87_15290 [Proteobacteria bacterium]|nr:hypothetical protein [Pseudomonadota bacterium]MBS0573583.1 hypothetical protein [Pseudomonadota bacterium]